MGNRVKKLVNGTAGGKRGTSARPTVECLEARELLSGSPLTPAQVRHAYGVDQASYVINGRTIQGDGSGQTIAIVVGYHDPYAASDLQTFDRQFGLPDPGFRQVQFGNLSNDQSSQETVLDIEWAHAIAPRANILLVEPASMNGLDLFTAVNWARQQPGVSVVSMSWGLPEFSGENSFDSILTTPAGHNGVTFLAATGDSGAAGNYPAMSPNVVAVGGSVLTVDAYGNYLGETGWSGSGGGYSRYEAEPAFQRTVQTTGVRTAPDVAYNADAAALVSWTQPSTGRHGWLTSGGTSAGAPQWAGIVAIANQIRVASGAHTLDGPSQTLYALYSSTMTADFHDITTGSNGYSALRGYDLVTGRGTPYARGIIADLARVLDSYHGPVAPMAAQTMARSVAQTASVFAVSVSQGVGAQAIFVPLGDAEHTLAEVKAGKATAALVSETATAAPHATAAAAPVANGTLLSVARALSETTAGDATADAVFTDDLWL
jgi:subtilase family serine protease